MSLATFNELQLRLPGETLQEDSMSILLAAVTSAAETFCNSYFGRRPSRMIPGESSTTLVCPGHGLVTGDYVVLSGMADSDLDGTHEVTVIPGEVPSFSIATGSDTTVAGGLVRKVMTRVFDTRGGDQLLLSPRPVADVTEVCVSSTPNTFSDSGVLVSTTYGLDKDGDNVSISGALIRYDGEWPYALSKTVNKYRTTARACVRVKYVCGSPVMPADVIDAALQLAAAIHLRGGEQPVASESLEYYSYSLLTSEALKSQPDSAYAALLRHRRIS